MKPRTHITLAWLKANFPSYPKAHEAFLQQFGPRASASVHDCVKRCWRRRKPCWAGSLLQISLPKHLLRPYREADLYIVDHDSTPLEDNQRLRRLDYRYARKLMALGEKK